MFSSEGHWATLRGFKQVIIILCFMKKLLGVLFGIRVCQEERVHLN